MDEPTSPSLETQDENDLAVDAFLARCREHGVAALVFYSFPKPDGGIAARMKSNSDPAGTAAAISWLQNTDERAIKAAARVLALELSGGSADDVAKARYFAAAKRALAAAKLAATGTAK